MINKNSHSLKANYFYNFIGQILVLIIPLITTPYLARILLETGNGQIAFSETVISYFVIGASLGFSLYGQRQIARFQNDSYERSKVFYEIVLVRFLFVISSCFLLLLTNSFSLYGYSYRKLIYIYVLQVVAVAFDFNFFVQGLEDFKTIALRTVLVKIVSLIFIFLFVKESTDAWIYSLIYCLSIVFSNLLIVPKISKNVIKVKFNQLEFKKHLFPAFIIFLPTLSATIYSSLDKIMIRYLCENPDYHNGCYSQALKINQTMLVLVLVINSIMIARNSKLFQENNITQIKSNVQLAYKYVIHLGVPLICGMAITANNLCSWFLGDGYKEVPILLSIMGTRFITSGIASVYGDQLFISIGKEKITTIAHITTGVVNLLLNFIFIPWLGAIGGAITTAICEFVDFIILFFMTVKFKYIDAKQFLASFIKPIIASLVMTCCIFYIERAVHYSIWSFLLIALVGFTIYIIVLFLLKDDFALLTYKKFIYPILARFKKKM